MKLLNDDYREFEYYKHLYNYMVREEKITCSYSSFRRYVKKDEDLYEVHEKLETINKEDNESISQGTNFPAVFLFKREKDKLQNLPSKDIRSNYYLKAKEVVVSNESLISYKSNKYSVPKPYIGKKVGRIIKNNKLHIYYNNKIITMHKIIEKKLNIKESHNLFYDRKLKSELITKETILEEMEAIIYDND
ncbi:MAG: hypothetical protein M0R46_14650 [Candidatus Muirbacterium halophilum]|nr:hypothetical protein [Candidatus Muirbacterium halophilum]